MKVTVVCVMREREHSIEIDVEPGTTAGEAVRRSGVLQREPALAERMMTVGVWNRVVPADHPIKDGDRIEIYRPLVVDPKEARRLRAELAKKRRR